MKRVRGPHRSSCHAEGMDPTAPIVRPTIAEAYRRIGGHIRRTPIMHLDAGTTLKLELTQHTGSFKARGATNRLLSEHPPKAGVVTASGGNHGAAVAWAARSLGIAATVFVPTTTPTAKRERIAGYGATVVVGGEVYDDAQRACDEQAKKTGAMIVHPFDHPAVVAGAATVALEFEDQAPDLDTVLVAVGGGGLAGGTAAWYLSRPMVRVVCVEPEGMASLHAALAAGEPIDVEVHGLAADSLGARRIGRLGFELCRAKGVQSLLIDEAAIVAAQRRLWNDLRIVAEPGGAAALAALWGGAYVPEDGERVGVIVCGANCDPGTVVG